VVNLTAYQVAIRRYASLMPQSRQQRGSDAIYTRPMDY